MQLDLNILRHAIGSDVYGRMRGDRNHFVTGPGSTDYTTCVALVERGLMDRTPGNAITGGDDVFRVTPAGRAFVTEHNEIDPNREWLCLAPWRDAWEWEAWFTVLAPTRSKARYQAFLELSDFSDMPKKDLIRIRVKAVPRPKVFADDTTGDDDLPF